VLQLENLFEIEKIKNLNADVIIFFTPGGWGDITYKEESYARSLLEGIRRTLKDWKYKTAVIGYPRTKAGILGKLKSMKEIVTSFPSESKKLADLSDNITKRYKNIRIILVGYSFGGAFVNEAMKKVKNGRIYGIEAGTPFVYKKVRSKNVLCLDNAGKDALAMGNFRKLSWVGVKGILKLVFLFKLIRLKISEAFHFEEHEYFWRDKEVKCKVLDFLGEKFKRK
jgi:hypothetical protein